MSDYEATHRIKRRTAPYKVPGQTEQLCNDIKLADEAGISYGVYIGCKASMKEEDYYKKFGVRLKRRPRP